MMDLLTFENFTSLGVLIFLQAVLGFDNLLYVSIESQRALSDAAGERDARERSAAPHRAAVHHAAGDARAAAIPVRIDADTIVF